MVSPGGCTMNFIFTDGTSNYIGTAGHCAGNGKTVIAQVATRIDPTDTVMATLAAIGTTVASWNNGIGKDFALVKINPAFKVVPGVAGALGPTGTFCGDPVGQPVMHYGHGYIFFVEQGDPKFGEVVPDLDLLVPFTTPEGYNWVGYGLPGDSGSEVMNAAGLAVGDLTHGIGVAGVPVPGLSFGTDMKEIFTLIGSSYSLVTVDGRHVNCAGADRHLTDAQRDSGAGVRSPRVPIRSTSTTTSTHAATPTSAPTFCAPPTSSARSAPQTVRYVQPASAAP